MNTASLLSAVKVKALLSKEDAVCESDLETVFRLTLAKPLISCFSLMPEN